MEILTWRDSLKTLAMAAVIAELVLALGCNTENPIPDYHIVKEGESISRIIEKQAKAYKDRCDPDRTKTREGADVQQQLTDSIISWNHITDPDKIKIGDTLYLHPQDFGKMLREDPFKPQEDENETQTDSTSLGNTD